MSAPSNKPASSEVRAVTPARVRFAPSPTGRLHIGNIRTATLNWLLAQKTGGDFLLRLDDTDRERSTPEFASHIRADLTWLGLPWDREETQSARFGRYADVAEQLKQAGLLYACYETEDELDKRRKRLAARNLPPVYDRASLKLTPAEHAKYAADGVKPYWRFLLSKDATAADARRVADPVIWTDLIRGEQTVDVASLSDPVLVRADGTPTYTFASVVDDADMGITHIIRGEDHVTNTGVQIRIFAALAAKVPLFAHHSLLVDGEGKPLSKRLGDLSVGAFRAAGLEPATVVTMAGLIGTSEVVEPKADLVALADAISFDTITRAPARFKIEDLEALNAKVLATLPYEAVKARLVAEKIGGGEVFWLAVRANITTFADVKAWAQVVSGAIPSSKDATAPEGFYAAAAKVLPAEPWGDTTWATWTNAVKTATGAKGRGLFHPLRLALTGRENGPELKVLLPLMGRATVLKRLG